MKRIIPILMAIFLISTTAVFSAENNGIFIDASFDDGINPFSVTVNEGNVEVVCAKEEGIGESGRVLKLTSDGSSNFIAKKLLESAITEKPIVMEARFRATSEAGVRGIFALESSAASRSRTHGLVTIRKNNNISSKPLIVLSEKDDISK